MFLFTSQPQAYSVCSSCVRLRLTVKRVLPNSSYITACETESGDKSMPQPPDDNLLQLPVDQREVVILKHLRDRTLQQIAGETGRTVPVVAGRLRRGLAKLREVMEEPQG